MVVDAQNSGDSMKRQFAIIRGVHRLIRSHAILNKETLHANYEAIA